MMSDHSYRLLTRTCFTVGTFAVLLVGNVGRFDWAMWALLGMATMTATVAHFRSVWSKPTPQPAVNFEISKDYLTAIATQEEFIAVIGQQDLAHQSYLLGYTMARDIGKVWAGRASLYDYGPYLNFLGKEGQYHVRVGPFPGAQPVTMETAIDLLKALCPEPTDYAVRLETDGSVVIQTVGVTAKHTAKPDKAAIAEEKALRFKYGDLASDYVN